MLQPSTCNRDEHRRIVRCVQKGTWPPTLQDSKWKWRSYFAVAFNNMLNLKIKTQTKECVFFCCKPANKREPYKVCQIPPIAGTCVAGAWVIYSTHCWGTWEAHGAHTCRKGPWHLVCHISLMRQAPATQALGLMLRWLMAVKNTILLVEFLNIRIRMLLKSTVATICPKY